MKNEKSEKTERAAKRRVLPQLPDISAPCIELSGNREALIEGCLGVLEYTPEAVRVNTAGMMLSLTGRGLNLRCISPSAVIVEGFITALEFTV